MVWVSGVLGDVCYNRGEKEGTPHRTILTNETRGLPQLLWTRETIQKRPDLFWQTQIPTNQPPTTIVGAHATHLSVLSHARVPSLSSLLYLAPAHTPNTPNSPTPQF